MVNTNSKNNDSIYEKLTPIFREVFDDEKVSPHQMMTASDVENWDSLSNILMIVAIEESFKINFSTGEITQLKNVGELVDVIAAKIKG